MCANCSISYSTVWRTGNAGLTLCNACGMFYNKHDHEHRPEHLIASARAKAEAQAAQAAASAAAAGSAGSPLRPRGSGLHGFTPDGGPTDGEMSDDGRRAGSDSEEEEGEGGRPRRRRHAQVRPGCSCVFVCLALANGLGPTVSMFSPVSTHGQLVYGTFLWKQFAAGHAVVGSSR
jgi:hypothetical protein